MTCHDYFKSCFWLLVIIEHNMRVFSRFVINVFDVVEARIALKMFFFFGPKIEARCSYRIVLIKRKACSYLYYNTQITSHI